MNGLTVASIMWMQMESTFQGRHRQPEVGRKTTLAGGIEMQMVPIQQTNGKKSIPSGITLIRAVIWKQVGSQQEICGIILQNLVN